jgi:hypothetical protein
MESKHGFAYNKEILVLAHRAYISDDDVWRLEASLVVGSSWFCIRFWAIIITITVVVGMQRAA